MVYARHKVYRSLIDPILFLGVPYQLFIMLGFIVLILIVITSFIVIPIVLAIFIYLFAVKMTKQDPRWMQILLTSAKSHGINLSRKGNRYVI